MKDKKIILIDEKDNKIGEEEKIKAHIEGKLHRALTIFIFNDERKLLITKRANDKMLWSDIWEASCSTHPYENEIYVEAGERRLKEELGISCKLKYLKKFQYKSKYKNIGYENEVCALLVGKFNGEIKPNLKEVSDYNWILIDDLEKAIEKDKENYAPWLKIGLEKF